MPAIPKLTVPLLSDLGDMANKLRIQSIVATTAGKSGHPTSCSSMAEIMSVLFFHVMRYNIRLPRDPSSDRFILSKGHAAPILYAAWSEAGLFPATELKNLRKLPYDLEGHPTPRLSFVDVATGSLGQGLSIGCGMAYVGKYFDKSKYRVYTLLGDAETAEGSVWEAMAFASYYKLDNLCAIIDCNRLGQTQETALGHDTEAYRNRVAAFGMNALVVDGHNIQELVSAFEAAACTKNRPTCIIAKTFKGKNFPDIENKDGWHGKALGDRSNKVIKHLEGLLNNKHVKMCPRVMDDPDAPCVSILDAALQPAPKYKLGTALATREAYGAALAKMVKCNPRVIALDADVKNSTFSEKAKEVDPQRHIECFIAEQNMIGTAIGMACRDRCVCFASTFSAFLCRAFDHIRMGAISQSNINIAGSHCGVSIGEDGPSQMGLEDLAMFRAVPGCTVFYPSDAVSCERAVELAANTEGICYIRLSRPATKVIYGPDMKFKIGEAKIIRQSTADNILIVAAGITLQEALKAYEQLKKRKINARIIDPFTIKPIDRCSIIANAVDCGGKILTVEDHYPEGGLGEAVMSAVAEQSNISVKKLAVTKVPRSGPCDALLEYYGIDARTITKAAGCMLGKKESKEELS